MTPAIDLLKRTKTPHAVLTYEHAPDAQAYGLEAAELLNQPPAQVFKTLVAQTSDAQLVVAMVPVDSLLDLKALATAAGAKKAAMADTQQAERATGYVVGGISPLGQKRRLKAFIHDSALAFAQVYVSGGRRGLEIALAPRDLMALTGAVAAPLAKPGQ